MFYLRRHLSDGSGLGAFLPARARLAGQWSTARPGNLCNTAVISWTNPRWRRNEYTYPTPRVYTWCMGRIRTNIEIDEVYLRRVMDRYGIHTKTEAVDLALRHLAGQPMTREEALAMEGAHAIGELTPDSGPRGAR